MAPIVKEEVGGGEGEGRGGTIRNEAKEENLARIARVLEALVY